MRANLLTCTEFVELVTDYLEGILDRGTAHRFEQHLRDCLGRDSCLDQFRMTIRLVGRIEPADVDPRTLALLLMAFRDGKVP